MEATDDRALYFRGGHVKFGAIWRRPNGICRFRSARRMFTTKVQATHMAETSINLGGIPHARSDGELLAEFVASRSERSFEQLVRRHAGMVLAVCRAILRNAADADDAAQAAFITLARRAVTLREQRTIGGWMHTVAWHVATRAREARQLRQRRERDAAVATDAVSPRAFSDDEDEARRIALVHEEIRALPEKYRVPLVLHHLEGWGEPEVARMLGCKLGTISGRLNRARRMLKERLESRGACEAAGAATMLTSLYRAGQSVSDPFISNLTRSVSSRGGSASAQAEALAQGALRMIRRASLRRAVSIVALVLVIIVGAAIALMQWRGSGDVPRRARVAPPGALTQITIARPAQLRGTVLDPDRRPTGDVTVRLYASRDDATAGRRAMMRTTTSAEGVFHFNGVPTERSYYLLCFTQQPTFMHGELDVAVAKDAQEVDAGTIVMKVGRY